MKKKLIAFSTSVLACTYVFAQEKSREADLQELEEVVVTDSKFQLKREQSGKTVIKITREELNKNQGSTLAEIISTYSGMEINGSRSNAGQNLGVYIRGGRDRQVLVVIDGVQVSDPSQISGNFDFRMLSTAQIQSIEIIKGAASTLYGNGAATAVINITTRKASDKKINLQLKSTVGTDQSSDDQNYNIASFNNSVLLSGTLKKFSYRTVFNQQFADGLSAAVGSEKDPYSKYGLDINLGYDVNKSFSVNIFGNLGNINSAYDQGSFTDAPFKFKGKQYRTGISSKYAYKHGSISVDGAYGKYHREFISNYPSEYESENIIINAYNKYTFHNKLYTVVGLNMRTDEVLLATNKESISAVDPYLNMVYVSDFGLHLNTGARLNNHSEYGSHITYSINPSYVYKIGDGYLKGFGSYSTSFIAPTITQLYGPFGPNPNLEPEENITVEGGMELKLNENFRASALYFNRKEENFVIYDFNTGYLNTSESVDTHGVEIELEAQPWTNIALRANYTFVENKTESPVRIPKHKGNIWLDYSFSGKTNATISYHYTYDRLDNNFSTFPATPVILQSYSLLNLQVNHGLKNNRLKLFAGLFNILNEEYSEIYGFSTRGRNIRVGFTLNVL